MKRAALYIKIPQTMNDPLMANKVRKTSWGLVSGLICAAVIIACLVGAIIVLINKRRQKRQAM